MKKVVLALCAFSLVLNLRAQVTINITPDRDNSIYSESNNSGGDGPLFSGETCSGNSRRALIHFDVAGNLPAGATITAVTLTLEVEQVGGSPSTNNYSISPLTANSVTPTQPFGVSMSTPVSMVIQADSPSSWRLTGGWIHKISSP